MCLFLITLGEPVSYPVNQVDGFELTIEKPTGSPFKGYTIRWAVTCLLYTSQEWNTRGKVVVWEIKQFFHKENQTIVEWYFKNGMNNGDIEEFDGISLIEWTEDNKIKSLKEFGCNRNTYNPYQESDTPQFRNQKANWF